MHHQLIVGLLMFLSVKAAATSDPTKPGRAYQGSAASVKRESGYLLSAIFISRGQPQAIINGTLVSKGHQFNDAVVEDISKDSVVMRQQRDGRWQAVTLHVSKPVSGQFTIRNADDY